MGRKLRTTLPTTLHVMKPQLPKVSRLQTKDKQIKKRQQQNFDQRHKATNLKPLQKGEGTVVNSCAPRSYIIQTDDQETYRRNRKMLLPLPSTTTKETTAPKATDTVTPNVTNLLRRPVVAFPIEQCPNPQPADNTQVTQTRSGRISKPPDRYYIITEHHVYDPRRGDVVYSYIM